MIVIRVDNIYCMECCRNSGPDEIRRPAEWLVYDPAPETSRTGVIEGACSYHVEYISGNGSVEREWRG